MEPKTQQKTEANSPKIPDQRLVSLDYSSDEADFRTNLARQFIEQKKTLTSTDLELLADYLCCAKLPNEEKSPVQQKAISLTRQGAKQSTSRPPRETSLEALIESPTFSESQFCNVAFAQPRPSFDRNSISRDSEAFSSFEELWKQIDRVDRFVKICQGKDVEPEATPDELVKAAAISSSKLYHLKQELVEMRRQQYTLKDSVSQELQRHDLFQVKFYDDAGVTYNWEDGWVAALPLGVAGTALPWQDVAKWGGKGDRETILDGNDFEEEREEKKEDAKFFVDFCNEEHVKMIVENWVWLKQDESPLCDTFEWYAAHARLTEEQKEILRLRQQGVSNAAITEQINEKFGQNHSQAYLSTIYNKKICKSMVAAAQLHLDSWKKRMNRYAFKKCKDCGQVLLIDERNFSKSKRSSDGFANRCKECERQERKNKKGTPIISFKEPLEKKGADENE